MDKGFTFIELKTTGFNPILDKICYIALTEFDVNMKPRRSYSTWLNPDAVMSDGVSKLFGVTNKELLEYPKFGDIVDILNPLIIGRTLGTFDSSVDIIEFLREALWDEDIKLRYLKKDFIVIKSLEDHLYKRDLNNLYFKYTGKNIKENGFLTQEAGEVFKVQCETIGVNPLELNYSKLIKNNLIDFTDRFLYEVEDELYLNFGRFKDKNIKDVQPNYIEWILENDFPRTVKEKIQDKIK